MSARPAAPAPAPARVLPWTGGREVLAGALCLHLAVATLGLVLPQPLLAGLGAGLALLSAGVLVAHRRRPRLPASTVAIVGVVAHGLIGPLVLGATTGLQTFLLVLPALALVDRSLPWSTRLGRAGASIVGYGLFVAILDGASPIAPLGAAARSLVTELVRVGALAVVGALTWAAVQAQERAAAADRTAADTDPLTGLLRRQPAFAAARQLRARARAEDRTVVLLVVEIDEMSAAVERAGEPGADALVRTTALRLASSLRRGDLIGRLGRAEFLMVIAGVAQDQVWDVLDRVHRVTETDVALPPRAGAPTSAADPLVSGRVSLGLATWDDDELLEECLSRADAALYQNGLRTGVLGATA